MIISFQSPDSSIGHLGALAVLRAALWKLASVDLSFWLLVRAYQRHAGRSLADERREKLGNSLPWLLLARCGLTVAGLLCQGPPIRPLQGLVTTHSPHHRWVLIPHVASPQGPHCPPRSSLTLPTPLVSSPFVQLPRSPQLSMPCFRPGPRRILGLRVSHT